MNQANEANEANDVEDDVNDSPDDDAKPAKAAKPKLPGVALRHLRALGHDLEPVVMVGKEGLTDGLVRATSAALLRHELIKVKVQAEAPVDRKDAAAALADAADAVLAQVLGRTFLLYRRHPKTPKIKLPKAAKRDA